MPGRWAGYPAAAGWADWLTAADERGFLLATVCLHAAMTLSSMLVAHPVLSQPPSRGPRLMAESETLAAILTLGCCFWAGAVVVCLPIRVGAVNRVLVIAAHPAETAQLPPEADVAVAGIGMSRAAAVTARAVLERAPSPEQRQDLVVVNLGSCGGLQPGLSGVFEPSEVLNRDVDAELMRAMGSDPDDRIPLAELGQVGDGSVLATGDSLVAGGAVRDALAERAQLVDMEGFAVAVACRELGVRLRMAKHVSDDADAQALEWLERVQVSARELAAWYDRSIGSLARQPHSVEPEDVVS